MGMESIYKMSVILNLVDNLSGNVKSAQDKVSQSINKMNDAFGSMQKTGAIMAGAGTAIMGTALSTVTATFDTQDALGELASLGVQDLKAVEMAAKNFSDTWAGTSKADFITASYDIKSGIASLSDEGVAQFTELAALTGKATKSTTGEMSSLFATGYGIYKGSYDDMSDLDFGAMFSAGISTAVKNYKTAGSEMASSISTLGATATNNNVPLEEQLAILGQLQTTMSGSEAATKYKSFLNQAAAAGEKLGLTFLDSNDQLLSTPEILNVLKTKYGETIDAVEKQKIKEAFGSDEAVAMIDLLYQNIGTLDTGIQDLQASMTQGIGVTEQMASAIQNTPAQKFETMKNQIHNNVEELGKGLLPAVNDSMDKINGLIKTGSDWINGNRETVNSIMDIAIKIGLFMAIAGGMIAVVGTVGKTFLGVVNIIRLVKTGISLLNLSFLASPVTWVIVGIVALIAVFMHLWRTSETFRNFWIGLFESVKSSFSAAWQAIQPALIELGQGFMRLWQAIQPILKVLGVVLGAVLTTALAQFVGIMKGMAAALAPLIKALTSLVDFVTNVVNIVVALFKGDFDGAVEFAGKALQNLQDFFKNGFEAIGSFLSGFADGFKSVMSGAFNAVDNLTGGKLSAIKAKFEAHGGGIKGAAAVAADGIKSAFGKGYEWVDNLTGGSLSKMKSTYESKGGGIKGAAAAVAEGVKTSFSTGYRRIDTLTDGSLTRMKLAYQANGGGIKGAAAAITGGIRTTFSNCYDGLNDMTGGKLSVLKSKFDTKYNDIKGTVTGFMDGVKDKFQTGYNAIDTMTDGNLTRMKLAYEVNGGGIKGAAAAITGGVRTIFSNFYDGLNNLTGGRLEAVKTIISEKIQAAYSVVTGILDNIKNAFTTKIDEAKNAVGTAIEAIKGFFNFSWSLPQIKVPEFSITGSFSLNPPSVPNIGIIWHAKGGIMTKPTIFGGAGNQLLGGGEAGAEAILPLSLLWEQMTSIIGNLFSKDDTDVSNTDTGKDIIKSIFSRSEKVVKESSNTESSKESKNDGIHIGQLTIQVDISKIKDLDMLEKLINELKDAQNRTEPQPA